VVKEKEKLKKKKKNKIEGERRTGGKGNKLN
jgi:hypothetical protein